ncbi:MAG: bifunctional oligoribonuclease/PAP phosphatase NrnA [Cyanomargarita calcarea GSE-NOS-MK-12-04C]|jgi:nanoRNase/pAp phosphatase (c-di-AMP/oligoRNAs hydrolase)|uniref:Bifunctional oligoribonuclease/PAP phosphatase NrnA n=1 Tax=Cyanomargarita calcarea GSE-NOS-MK-12-04C TaxID=2839659 RepID=A0A951QMU3_9CYAN|nr:bifunctional oligoribonuclease/PAP phosphatase NrnA [Cyanomargarita calcarea GSE-NOS-MK-12-04C]
MQVNSSLTQLESLPLTTELTPDDAETDKEPVEIPLGKQSIAAFTGDAGTYLGQRSNSITNHKSEELRQTLLSHRHERQLVILQDFPDPDALSSAWAYQLIAQQYDIKCEIIYAGTLSHQENIALVKLTGLPAHRWSMPTLRSKDLSSYQGFVLIDNQGTTSGLLAMVLSSGIPLIAVIDHHSFQGELKSEFVDVRPTVRATATIFTQYIQAGLLNLDSSINQHVKCATALMHGLRSDTNRLMQAQEEDFMAAAYLSRYCDAQLLNTVLQANRSKPVMDVIERSLKNRIVQNNFSIAGVGYLRYDDRDAIPQAADFLVTEENVHTAVVYGIVHDEDEELEIVVGSLRTSKLTLDPDEFIKEAFGQDSSGRFFGGGRTSAGGFEIPMGFLSGGNENSAYAKIKWEVFDAQIKQKLLRLVNPKDNPIHPE